MYTGTVCFSGRIRSTVQTAGSAQRQKPEAGQSTTGRQNRGHAGGEQTRCVVYQRGEEDRRRRRRRQRLPFVQKPSTRLRSLDGRKPEIIGGQPEWEKTVHKRSDGVIASFCIADK